MGQVLIRNLDDDVIAAYREEAARNQRSLEAELRQFLVQFRPRTKAEIADAKRRFLEIQAMTPKNVRQTPSEQLVREMRDSDGFRHE